MKRHATAPCANHYAPVVGANGSIWGNACLAAAAGQRVARPLSPQEITNEQRWTLGQSLPVDATKRTPGEKVALAVGLTGIVLSALGLGLGFYARRRKAASLAGLGRIETAPDGTAKTPANRRVRLAKQLVEQLILDPVMGDQMRELGLQVTRPCPDRDDVCEARAVAAFVATHADKTHIGAILPGEYWQSTRPDAALRAFRTAYAAIMRQTTSIGTRDDKAILTAVLLTENGVPARFRLTAPTKDASWDGMHVLVGLPKTAPRKWVPVAPATTIGRTADFNA